MARQAVEPAAQGPTPSATPAKAKCRPAKPYPEFPLFPHRNGSWAKKICGRFHYFGPWADSGAALDKYLAQKDHLFAGAEPPDTSAGVTLEEVVDRFLVSKLQAVKLSEISQRQYADYLREGNMLLDVIGRYRPASTLTPMDFARLRAKIAETCNATTMLNRIVRIRSIFRWAGPPPYGSGLLQAPPHYGQEFRCPSAKALRRVKAERGEMMFEPPEIHALLKRAKGHVNLYAMILLGVNCGFNNSECAALEVKDLKLAHDKIDCDRPKTVIDRKAFLWPETIAALLAALTAQRREGLPAELSKLVFVTLQNRPYAHQGPKGPVDSVGIQFRRMVLDLGLVRKGRAFAALRHTFQTIAEETLDFPAVKLCMGHVDASMSGVYRERIGDDRLRAVAEHVRAWLYGSTKTRRT